MYASSASPLAGEPGYTKSSRVVPLARQLPVPWQQSRPHLVDRGTDTSDLDHEQARGIRIVLEQLVIGPQHRVAAFLRRRGGRRADLVETREYAAGNRAERGDEQRLAVGERFVEV